MKIQSHNEWDTLQVSLLGTVDKMVPGLSFEVDANEKVRKKAAEIAMSAYPNWYLNEVKEDLDGLGTLLKQAGVKVLRPIWEEQSTEFSTPNWQAHGFDLYNVRDLNIVIGNNLITSASSTRFRIHESLSINQILYDNFFDDGFNWINAPTPRLKDGYLKEVKRTQTKLEKTEDLMHSKLSNGLEEKFHKLTEDEIIFDAANIIRINNDILFLVSNTGNRKAAKWLQRLLGEAYKVHVTQAYRSSHLDSTILPLNSKTVLLNGARVNEHNCPTLFEKWNKIYFSDVVPLPAAELTYFEEIRLPAYKQLNDLKVGSNLGHISSPWAGLNVLSVDPETVFVHDLQKPLIKELERHKFTVVPVQLRHCYSMLGGLHCATLDLVRA